MAKVEASQLVSPKVLEPLRQEIKLTEEQLKQFDAQLTKNLQSQAKLASQVQTSTKGLQKMNEINRQSKKTLSEKERIEKQIATVQKRNTQITKEQRERLAALRVEEQRRNKVAKQSAIETNKNIGAFEKLNLKIKKLSDRYRNLLVEEGKETRQTQLLRKRILELNAARDRANKSIGIHSANVGNYRSALTKLTATLGKLGLAFGVFQIVRSVFSTVKNFDQATADLSAVLGVTSDEMARLTEQAKELGATTIFTASEVSELQKEYAKLGFTQREIEGVTEATLQLAAATNSELGTSAEVVGSTLRAFGLDVSQTQRVVDVMAKSFSASSLDMEKFTVAMRAVAPVAKNAGFTIEQTTALIGTITDAGVDASTAGTGLRNVFLELAKTGKTFEEAMAEINNATDKNAASLALFGKRGAVIGTILAESGEKAAGLAETLNEAGGAAEEMADKQLDTLGGAIKLLVSAWEGFILKMNESSGAGNTLKNVIVFLAENLDLILSTLLTLLKVWATYRIVTWAATTAIKAYTFAQNLATNGLKAFNAVTKLNPFGAIAAALVFIVPLFMSFNETVQEGQREVKDYSDEIGGLTRVNAKFSEELAKEELKLKTVFERLKETTAGTRERKEALDEVNKEYGLTLQNLSDEGEFVRQLDAAYNSLIAQMEKKIRLSLIEQELTTLLAQRIELEDSMEDKLSQRLRLQQKLNEAEAQAVAMTGNRILDEEANRERLENIRLAQEALDRFDQANISGGLLDVVNKQIEELKDETEKVNGLGISIGGSSGGGKTVDAEKKRLDRLKALREEHNLDLLRLENELIAKGEDKEVIEMALHELRKKQFREEAQLIQDLNFKTDEEAVKLRNKYLKFLKETGQISVEIEQNTADEIKDIRIDALKEVFKEMERQEEERKKLQEQLIKSIRDTLADASKVIQTFLQNNIDLLDRQIEAQEKIFNESKDRENELKQIAKERGLDASESINAEREAQKKAIAEQRRLEQERQRAEALIAALQAFAAQVKAGQGNPVQNIKGSILNLKSFVEGQFIEGTDYTLGDALGRNGIQDGHIIAADDSEAIFNPAQTKALDIGRGKNSTQDIVNMYRNGFRNNASGLNLSAAANVGDKKLHKKIDQLINVTKNIVDPNGLTFDTVAKTLNYRNKSKGVKYSYPVSKRRV